MQSVYKVTVKAVCDVRRGHTVLMSLELYKYVLFLSQDSNTGKYSKGFPMKQTSTECGEDKLQLTDEVTRVGMSLIWLTVMGVVCTVHDVLDTDGHTSASITST